MKKVLKVKNKVKSSTRRPRKTSAKRTYKVYDSVEGLVNDAPIGVSGIDPTIFEKAAELVGNGEHEFCCHALVKAAGGYSLLWSINPYCDYFTLALKPKNLSEHDTAWYSDYLGASLANRPALKEDTQRMMGLLLCAELVREGYVPKGFSNEQS